MQVRWEKQYKTPKNPELPYYKDGKLYTYPFDWNKIPGAEADRFLSTLSLFPGLEWFKSATVEKISDKEKGERLKISCGERVFILSYDKNQGFFYPKSTVSSVLDYSIWYPKKHYRRLSPYRAELARKAVLNKAHKFNERRLAARR